MQQGSILNSEEAKYSNHITYKEKIVFLGPPGSGKSSLIQAIIGEPFNHDIKQTNCYQYHIKTFTLDEDTKYQIKLWDCSSNHNQSYSTVKKAFYRDAFSAFIVIDLSQYDQNFGQVDQWVNECFDNDIYNIFVIGNKTDLLMEEPKETGVINNSPVSDEQQIQLTDSILIISGSQVGRIQKGAQLMINDLGQKGLQVFVGSCQKDPGAMRQIFVNLLQKTVQNMKESMGQNLLASNRMFRTTYRTKTNRDPEQIKEEEVFLEKETQQNSRRWCQIF